LPDRAPVVDLLEALGGVLCRLGARWYLFGAQAVTVWGRPRMSADVDVTIELDLLRVPELLDLMARAGFTLRVRTGVGRRADPLDAAAAGAGARSERPLAGVRGRAGALEAKLNHRRFRCGSRSIDASATSTSCVRSA
jgi:hypothetical protein